MMLVLRDLRNATLDLAGLIDDELYATGFPSRFSRAALLAGGLLVLLDGLDEVPADRLDETIRAIRNLADQHPRCRYIISCRTAFYKDYFPRFTDALLTDFTDDQIQNLIHNWFHRELDTATKLWNLLKAPEHQATRELARTPLLATFLCLVYDDRQKLPTNRADLYGDALRILLERWAASKRVHGEPVFPGLSTKRELLMLEGIAGPTSASSISSQPRNWRRRSRISCEAMPTGQTRSTDVRWSKRSRGSRACSCSGLTTSTHSRI